MISLVPAVRQTARPVGPRLKALGRQMLESWLAHYQRVHDLGLRGGF